MKMQIIRQPFTRTCLLALAAIMLTITAASCRKMLYEYEGDCDPRYRVHFRYTRNILNTDAFGSQVSRVSLYLFDKQGNLVYRTTRQRALTADNDFYIEVDVEPGVYDMLVWCEGEPLTGDPVSFLIGGGENPASIDELSATLPLEGREPQLYSGRDITRLYHGIATGVEFPDTFGDIDIAPIDLTRDTNHLTLQILNTDGTTIDPSNLSVELEAENSCLNYLNLPVGERKFVYTPWSQKPVNADIADESGRAGAGNGVQFEITTGRLIADMPQRLTIRRVDTGGTVIEIPLIEYLLLVRSEYEVATSNQDYLDRYDDYSMVFFMQGGYNWIKSRVLINGWRRVPPQDDIQLTQLR